MPERINVSQVRRMTKAPRKDHLLNLPAQRVTVRCECGWYMRDVLASESTKLYKQHRRRKCR